MKYEFIIKDDILSIEVSLLPKLLVSDKKILVVQKDIEKLIHENFICPKNFIVGKCLDHKKNLDNSIKKRCTGTWSFELLEIQSTKTRKKTSIKKEKRPR